LIPGPTGFYAALLVLLALAVALVGLGWRIYRRLQNRLPATGE
jgi:membrane protein implicated in regulation of membrane protease activity